MTFKFNKGEILVPKTQRTFGKLVYPKLIVEAYKDKNYVLKTPQGKLIKFSFLFIENNYEKESEAQKEIEQELDDENIRKSNDRNKSYK